jgi:hypothetical protein
VAEANPTSETVSRLNSLLDVADKPPEKKSETDWQAESEALDLLESLYRIHSYAIDGNLSRGVTDCGSYGFRDTPRVLYRLIYLFSHQAGRWPTGQIAPQPGHRPWPLDFGDMYKSSSLFAIVSPDYRFVADPQFYKYELMLSWRATPQHVAGLPYSIVCGVPGSDNGVNPATPELKAWQALLVRMLEREWDVYSGNNFKV